MFDTIRKVLAIIALAVIASCTEQAGNEYPTAVLPLTKNIELRPNETGRLLFRVAPQTAEVNMDMIFIAASDGSSELKPAEKYRITKVEASVNSAGAVTPGQFVAYVQDAGVSGNYSEKAKLVINAGKNQIVSSEFEISCREPSKGIDKFSLNGYSGRIDGSNITVKVSHNTNLSQMKASFEVFDATVYVGQKEQVSGETANDFSAPVEYRVVNVDGEEYVYSVSVCFSSIPTVFVKTAGNAEIKDKENWIEGSTMYVTNSGDKGWDGVYNNMNIRGRGNSTWGYEKKPYAIKLDKKAEVLGMPKHKRWVLLANYLDRTCMRNAVAFQIARKTDLAWTPRGEFVDLVINGKFLGNYFLCEQIKLDEKRVNIAEMEPTDLGGDAITGGYLLELDSYFDEVNKFRSNLGRYHDRSENDVPGLPVMIKEPDEDVLQQKQFDYIKGYFCEAEALVWKEDKHVDREYTQYIDVESFIDWWFVHELTENAEPKHPKSSYMHKDRNGKLTAGPVWDFDWETFTQNNSTKFCVKETIWYPQLFQDPAFVEAVKQRWKAQKPGFEEVLDFIDETIPYIKESANANAYLWPNIKNGINKDHKLSFSDASDRLRTVYSERIKWLDSAINDL